MRLEANALRFAGHSVLMPRAGIIDQMSEIKEIHRRKIDASDEILVVNPLGYIGDDTREEIIYAENAGKIVKYTDSTERAVVKCETCKGLGRLPCGRCSCGSGEGCTQHDTTAIAMWGLKCSKCQGTGKATLQKGKQV